MICAVVIGLAWDSRLGIVAGGLVGPLVGLAAPGGEAGGSSAAAGPVEIAGDGDGLPS